MMSIDLMLGVLGWAAIINFAVLCLWVGIFVFAHSWLYGLHGKIFKISIETFDAIHYGAMAFYKLSIFLFFLAPYIALTLLS